MRCVNSIQAAAEAFVEILRDAGVLVTIGGKEGKLGGVLFDSSRILLTGPKPLPKSGAKEILA